MEMDPPHYLLWGPHSDFSKCGSYFCRTLYISSGKLRHLAALGSVVFSAHNNKYQLFWLCNSVIAIPCMSTWHAQLHVPSLCFIIPDGVVPHKDQLVAATYSWSHGPHVAVSCLFYASILGHLRIKCAREQAFAAFAE
jgi:hypothetical protein